MLGSCDGLGTLRRFVRCSVEGGFEEYDMAVLEGLRNYLRAPESARARKRKGIGSEVVKTSGLPHFLHN